jgi:hypothetical protein
MSKRKYPTSLFIIGFITNIVFRFFLLFASGIVLLIVGIFMKPCLYIGLGILILDIILSLIDQLLILRAFLKESDNPDFREFQDALSKDGNWKENVGELLNKKLSDHENIVEPNAKAEND